jgi:hypothetical protein
MLSGREKRREKISTGREAIVGDRTSPPFYYNEQMFQIDSLHAPENGVETIREKNHESDIQNFQGNSQI